MLARHAALFVVVAGSIAVVALLAVAVSTGSPETAIDALDPVAIDRAPALATIAEAAGSLPIVAVAVLAIALAARSWRMGLAIIAIAASAEVVTAMVKVVVDRPRPALTPATELFGSASFPSGHVVRTAAAVGLAVVVLPWARRHPWVALALGVSVVAGMAVGRVAAGAHHASDVLAGMLVAAGLLATVAVIGSVGTSGFARTTRPFLLALLAAPLSTSLTSAASPSPALGGDPRVPDGGASLIGEPVVAIVATLVVGLTAAVITWLFVRLTPKPPAPTPRDDPPR